MDNMRLNKKGPLPLQRKFCMMPSTHQKALRKVDEQNFDFEAEHEVRCLDCELL